MLVAAGERHAAGGSHELCAEGASGTQGRRSCVFAGHVPGGDGCRGAHERVEGRARAQARVDRELGGCGAERAVRAAEEAAERAAVSNRLVCTLTRRAVAHSERARDLAAGGEEELLRAAVHGDRDGPARPLEVLHDLAKGGALGARAAEGRDVDRRRAQKSAPLEKSPGVTRRRLSHRRRRGGRGRRFESEA